MLSMTQRRAAVTRLTTQIQRAFGTTPTATALTELMVRVTGEDDECPTSGDTAVLAANATAIIHATLPKQLGYLIDRLGIDRATHALNQVLDSELALGPAIIRSQYERGYWCNASGWIPDPCGATGYPAALLMDVPVMLGRDAKYVLFDDAIPFEH